MPEPRTKPFTNHGHEMTLDERRAFFLKDIVHAEENFAEGTVSRQFLDFFKYLQTNTDLFDTVMVRIMMDASPDNRNALRLPENEIKELINTYLEGDVTIPAHER
jgi:hypothetical protein